MTTPAQEAEFWNGCASDPDLSRKWLCGEPELTEATVGYIMGSMPTGGRLLDLGCGDGRLAVAITEQFPLVNVFGFDISDEIVTRHAKWTNAVCYEVVNGRSFLPKPGRFHGAYSVAMFQHLPLDAVRSYFQSVFDSLKPTACFVAQFVVGSDHDDFRHEYTGEQIKDAAHAAGFDVPIIDYNAIQKGWAWCIAVKP